MAIQHLRRNAVAYLALAVACTTGTAYAADQISNGSVTTKKLAKDAVTSPKIKKNAVRSSDVKDGSLTAADLAAGAVPGATWVGGASVPGGDPAAVPDASGLVPRAFTLPRAGKLQVTAHFEAALMACTVGPGHLGLYVDGQPVPGSRTTLTSDPITLTVLGLVDVTAGAHQVTYGVDCPESSPSGYDTVLDAYSLVLGE
jgi:hypothetical protein